MSLSAILNALSDPYVVIRFMHFMGAIIAVGAVTVTDSMLFFLHFRDEFAPILDKVSALLSLVVWVGLLLLSTSGIYLVFNHPDIVHGWIFQTKIALVSIVFLNGIILNEKVNPRFHSLADEWSPENGDVSSFERYAGIFAAISVIGWWSIILLVYLKSHL